MPNLLLDEIVPDRKIDLNGTVKEGSVSQAATALFSVRNGATTARARST